MQGQSLRWLVPLTLWLCVAVDATALPRMALTAGSPCATCHVTAQGGGIRNNIGFVTSQNTGAIPWSKLGVASFDHSKPSWGNDTVTIGADLRSVIARLGRPTGTTEKAELPGFLYVPMQVNPYIGVKPTSWLDLVGTYNAVTAWRSYQGQSAWEAFARIHGPADLPTARVGMIQPTIGIRHDDHTMLIRATASDARRPIIPAGYAELGAEVGYQPRQWLRVDVGGFRADNLSKTAGGAVKADDFAYSARLTLLPQFIYGGSAAASTSDEGDDDFGEDDDDFGEDDSASGQADVRAGSINTWIGGSVYAAGDFQMINGFFGIGASELASLMIEAAQIQRGTNYTGLNLMALLSIRAGYEWLYFNIRAEQATATDTSASTTVESKTQQLVVGFELFPLPYFEVRPEYRILVTDAYRMNHYTLQFHTAF